MSVRPARFVSASAALVCALAGSVLLAPGASAVTVTKGELKNGELLVSGRGAPNLFTTASSTTSEAGARADLKGDFTIRASGFTAPDCKVVVSDLRTAVATVTLSGCTPTVKPVGTPAPPTGSCVIAPQQAPDTLTAGVGSVVWFTTTGCDASSVLRWSVVAGVIPTGMSGPTYQGPTSGNISGTPTVPGTYRFTLQAVDPAGASDQENVTVTVA